MSPPLASLPPFLFTFYPDKKEKTGEMSVPLRFTNTSPVLVAKLYFVLL